MKYLAPILLCLFLARPQVQAQELYDYQPQVCAGRIPQEFITPSTEKYKKEIERLRQERVKGREKKGMKEFALLSNFWEDDLLQSGYVLFNDPLSEYVREVFDQITAAEPQLRDQVRIFTLRTPEVNAFASDRGNIFVTLGMLAQLEDEAQLAYILAHELVHYKKKHAINLFLEVKNFKRGARAGDVLNKTVFEDATLARHYYSRELESEADQQGLEIFLKTNYSTHTLGTVFDVLRYGYLPFDDIPFDYSILESEWYNLPQTVKLDSVSLIQGEEEDADDTRRSHPNLSKRRRILEEGIAGMSNEGRQLYLVSEERFKKARETARFELPQLYLEKGRLPEAIYNAFLLKTSFPENKYLDKSLAKAFYLLAKYKNENMFGYKKNYKEVEGESQQLHYLAHSIPAKDATILALRYVWGVQQSYPDDAELSALTDDLFQEFTRYFSDLSPFSDQIAPDTVSAETKEPETDDTQPSSKYEKIRKQKKAREGKEEYWRTALAEYLDDPDFISCFEKNRDAYLKRKEKEAYYTTQQGKRELAKMNKKLRKKGLELGIPRIVLVNPYFARLNERNNNEEMLLPTAIGQEKLRELISKVASKSRLDIQILDVTDLKEDQTDQFNDIRLLNTWFGEQIRHFDLTLTPGVQQEKVAGLADKYKTDYFLWTGVLSQRQNVDFEDYRRGGMFNVLFRFLIPRNDMMIYAILFDVRTGRREVVKFNYFRSRETDTLVKVHLYDAFRQISSGSK